MREQDRRMAGRLVRLTIPAAIDFGLQSAASYADYIMVGRLGQNASASIGLTTEVNFLFRGLLTALGIGLVSFIAIAEGRMEREESKRACVQALYIALVSGIILMCIALAISPNLPGWMGAEKEIWTQASGYFRITYFGIIGAAFNMMFGSVLKGIGDMKTPMYVNVGMNLFNVFLNFWLIFGNRTIDFAGHAFSLWGAGLGVYGAAWATAIANIAGGICMFAAAYTRKELRLEKNRSALNFEIIRKILLVAYPVFLCRAVTSLGRILFTSFVTGLGTTIFAAHTIAFTAESLFYMPVVGAQSAVTTLAGNAKGEGDRQKLHSLVNMSCILTGGVMLVIGFFMVIVAVPVLSFFTTDRDVVDIGRILFCIVAVNEPIFGISVVLEGIFNGLGDTTRTFIISALTLWIVRVLGTWLAINILHTGVYGAWTCMVLENAARGIALLICYRRRREKIINIVIG